MTRLRRIRFRENRLGGGENNLLDRGSFRVKPRFLVTVACARGAFGMTGVSWVRVLPGQAWLRLLGRPAILEHASPAARKPRRTARLELRYWRPWTRGVAMGPTRPVRIGFLPLEGRAYWSGRP